MNGEWGMMNAEGTRCNIFSIQHSAVMHSLSTSRYVNIEDLRRGAQRRLPRAVFDYIDGGADRENTLDRNSRAYNDITFRPRCAVAVKNYEMKTTVLGTEIA